MQARLDRRLKWAQGREQKADALQARNEPFVNDWAFITQPGHIPERERCNRRDEKAYEHRQMVQHHEEKAAGIERQLERTIFSDDEDAPDRLRERIAGLENDRGRIKAYNATAKKAAKTGGTGDLSLLTEEDKADLISIVKYAPYQLRPGRAFPAYKTAYIGANIRRLEERLAQIVGTEV